MNELRAGISDAGLLLCEQMKNEQNVIHSGLFLFRRFSPSGDDSK